MKKFQKILSFLLLVGLMISLLGVIIFLTSFEDKIGNFLTGLGFSIASISLIVFTIVKTIKVKSKFVLIIVFPLMISTLISTFLISMVETIWGRASYFAFEWIMRDLMNFMMNPYFLILTFSVIILMLGIVTFKKETIDKAKKEPNP